MKFPDQFIWGAGTSSYQVEGASRAGGKGPSIWDTFCERPGVISDGQSGEIACDQFHRLEQDVAAMAEIGRDRLFEPPLVLGHHGLEPLQPVEPQRKRRRGLGARKVDQAMEGVFQGADRGALQGLIHGGLLHHSGAMHRHRAFRRAIAHRGSSTFRARYLRSRPE